jgi:hypothetical protein
MQLAARRRHESLIVENQICKDGLKWKGRDVLRPYPFLSILFSFHSLQKKVKG